MIAHLRTLPTTTALVVVGMKERRKEERPSVPHETIGQPVDGVLRLRRDPGFNQSHKRGTSTILHHLHKTTVYQSEGRTQRTLRPYCLICVVLTGRHVLASRAAGVTTHFFRWSNSSFSPSAAIFCDDPLSSPKRPLYWILETPLAAADLIRPLDLRTWAQM